MAADDYAILVGICRYPGHTDLNGPENDVDMLRAWLVDAGGGGVPPGNVCAVVSSVFGAQDGRPTVVDIDDACQALIDRGRNDARRRAGRRLYLMLAGHGLAPSLADTALLAANAPPSRVGDHIAGRLYATWFQTAAYFEEVVLFMDCCRDDLPWTPPRLPPWPEERGERSVRRFFGFATQWRQQARERQMQDGIVRGLFTTSVVDALRNAAPDANGRITGAVVEAHVYGLMQRLSEGGEYQEAEFDFNHMQDVVFVSRGTPGRTPVRVTFSEKDPRASVELQDGTLRTLDTRQGTDTPWMLQLPPGLYKVINSLTGTGTVFEVIGQAQVQVHA